LGVLYEVKEEIMWILIYLIIRLCFIYTCLLTVPSGWSGEDRNMSVAVDYTCECTF